MNKFDVDLYQNYTNKEFNKYDFAQEIQSLFDLCTQEVIKSSAFLATELKKNRREIDEIVEETLRNGNRYLGSFLISDTIERLESNTNFNKPLDGKLNYFKEQFDIFKTLLSEYNLNILKREVANDLIALFHEFVGLYKNLNVLQSGLQKLENNTFTIGFVANVNAGKSTLLNALCACDLLPAESYFRTGCLTYLYHTGNKDIHIEIVPKEAQSYFVITYKAEDELKRYVKKYKRYNWVEKIELAEKGTYFGDFQPDDLKSIYPHQAKITFKKDKKVYFKQKKIEQKELKGWANNPYIDHIKIGLNIPFLKNHPNANQIYLIDTPGYNSSEHPEHKYMTQTFIENADVIVYVLDNENISTGGQSDFLKDIIKTRKGIDPSFYEKFIFVVNKIDRDRKEDEVISRGLTPNLLSLVSNTLQKEGYGIKAEQMYGVSARAALLYEEFKNDNLSEDNEELFWGVCSRHKRKQKVNEEKAKELVYKYSFINELKNKLISSSDISTLENQNFLKLQQVCIEIVMQIDDRINKKKESISKSLEQLEEEKAILEKNIETVETNASGIEASIKTGKTNILDLLSDKFAHYHKNYVNAEKQLLNKHMPTLAKRTDKATKDRQFEAYWDEGQKLLNNKLDEYFNQLNGTNFQSKVREDLDSYFNNTVDIKKGCMKLLDTDERRNRNSFFSFLSSKRTQISFHGTRSLRKEYQLQYWNQGGSYWYKREDIEPKVIVPTADYFITERKNDCIAIVNNLATRYMNNTIHEINKRIKALRTNQLKAIQQKQKNNTTKAKSSKQNLDNLLNDFQTIETNISGIVAKLIPDFQKQSADA